MGFVSPGKGCRPEKPRVPRQHAGMGKETQTRGIRVPPQSRREGRRKSQGGTRDDGETFTSRENWPGLTKEGPKSPRDFTEDDIKAFGNNKSEGRS